MMANNSKKGKKRTRKPEQELSGESEGDNEDLHEDSDAMETSSDASAWKWNHNLYNSLPKYNGNPEEFPSYERNLTTAWELARLHPAAKEELFVKAAGTKLSDAASKVLDRNKDDLPTTVDELLDLLKRGLVIVEKNAMTWWGELMDIRQRDDEGTVAYCQRFGELYQRVELKDDPADDAAKTMFLKGLKAAIRSAISETPEDLESLMTAAEKAQLKLQTDRNLGGHRTGFYPRDTRGHRGNGSYRFHGNQPHDFDRRNGPKPVTAMVVTTSRGGQRHGRPGRFQGGPPRAPMGPCFHCHQTGHIKRGCPLLAKNKVSRSEDDENENTHTEEDVESGDVVMDSGESLSKLFGAVRVHYLRNPQETSDVRQPLEESEVRSQIAVEAQSGVIPAVGMTVDSAVGGQIAAWMDASEVELEWGDMGELCASMKDMKLPADFILTGSLAEVKGINCLFDSGASVSFISMLLVKRLNLQVECIPPLVISFANGDSVTACERVRERLCVGNRSLALKLVVLPRMLGGIDVVVGRDMMATHGVVLEMATKKVRFAERNGNKKSEDDKMDGGEERPMQAAGLGTVQSRSIGGELSRKLRAEDKDELMKGELKFGHLWGCEVQVNPEQGTVKEKKSPTFQEFLAGVKSGEARQLLAKYEDVFRTELPPGLPKERANELEIVTRAGHVPYYRRPYTQDWQSEKITEMMIDELVRKGFVEERATRYGAPAFLTKNGNKQRLVINYSQLNQDIIETKFPLPTIRWIIEKMSRAKLFSTLDCVSSFHQLRVSKDSVEKTGFVTPTFQGVFLVAPFGLSISGACWQFALEQILKNIPSLNVYVDDVILSSDSERQHLLTLEKVLQRAREERLYLKLGKAVIMQPEVRVLGFVVKDGTVRPEFSKVEAITKYPEPKNLRQLRGFLGIVAFVQQFIKNRAEVARPLHDLLRKNVKWQWGEEQQRAFDQLKVLVSQAPDLVIPRDDQPFELHCDSSDFACGGMLVQNGAVVSFFSRTFNEAQKKYSIRDKELLAILFGLRMNERYLRGAKFVIKTDHATLTRLQTQKASMSKLHGKFLDYLAGFGVLQIHHIPGSENSVPDALSRLKHGPELGEEYGFALVTEVRRPGNISDALLQEIRKGTAEDNKLLASLATFPNRYRQKDGIVYFSEHNNHDLSSRICVPNNRRLITKIIAMYHDGILGGHRGYHQTYLRMKPTFAFPNMLREVEMYVASCLECKRSKYRTQKAQGLLRSIESPVMKWSIVNMDFFKTTLNPETGHDSVWVVIDRLTKRAHFFGTSESYTAEEKARQYIREIVRLHGLPVRIISDADHIFLSKMWSDLMRLLQIDHPKCTTGRPEADGLAESTIKNMRQMLRCYMNEQLDNWEEMLPALELCYNASVNSSTGFAPFELDNGWNVNLPVANPSVQDVELANDARAMHDKFVAQLEEAKDVLARSQDRQMLYANKGRKAVQIHEGDLVLVDSEALLQLSERDKVSRKGRAILAGPFPVEEVITATTFRVTLPLGSKARNVFNADRLVLYRPSNDFPGRPPPRITSFDKNGEPMYTVEKILERKRQGRSWQYKVKWLGYDDDKCTWESKKTLTATVPKMVNKFDELNP